MNKKGFTLVELLGVIVIITVMFLLTYKAVEHIIFKSRDTVGDSQINTILKAAYDYSLENLNILPEKNDTTYITLVELKSAGLIEYDITNPSTKELYPNDLVISISNVGAGYKYSNPNSKLNGDYLYTVMIENVSMISDDTKPIITLSDGKTFEEVNINSSYSFPTYTATSSSGIDLTNKVFVSITFNDKAKEHIDTSNLGIYKIYYTVVDNYGYSSMVIRSVVITDKEKPNLEIPESLTISMSTTEYNLLDGVFCTDNSNICNITYTDTIKYGMVGVYTVTYTAKDSSGNTTTKERIITIE